MAETSNLGLPFIEAGQAQKHVTHNEALRLLDTLVQLAVQGRDLTVPPGAPVEGERWIVKAAASGSWAGHDNHIAAWQDGAWAFSVPAAGWLAYVLDAQALIVWNGSAWISVSTGEGGGASEMQNLSLLGIGTEADAVNPLSARLNNVLWAARTVAEGGDGTLRYKLSKESADKTLSLLFQDGFVGCAEIGLAGDDDLHFKVSPDGTEWLEALTLDRATARVSFPGGGVREVLAANRTYYVRTDGSDENNGLADSAGGAFLTIQKALDVARTFDLNGFALTVQVGAGTYSGGVSVDTPFVGGNPTILGNMTTPANVVISTNGMDAISVKNNAILDIAGLKLQTSGSGVGVHVQAGAIVNMTGKCEFGVCANSHIDVAGGGSFNGFGVSYEISGGAQAHVITGNTGQITIFGAAVTITNAPVFSTAFAYAQNTSVIQLNSNTYSGTASGMRYSANSNSVIQTFTGNASYLPGSMAGTTSSGGQYA